MKKLNSAQRRDVIQDYYKTGSLRKSAKKFDIPYATLWRWVKKFNNFESEIYKRPWNRPDPQLEETVMRLKEEKPWLTIESAHSILDKKGIKISTKGIHSIWKRYNLINRYAENVFTTMAKITPESRRIIENVEIILSRGSDNKILKKSSRDF